MMDDQTMLGLFNSLKREFDSLKPEFEASLVPVKDSLERIEARMDRHGGIIQGGTRQVSRLITWSEEIDHMLADRDRRIEDLTRRMDRLEGK